MELNCSANIPDSGAPRKNSSFACHSMVKEPGNRKRLNDLTTQPLFCLIWLSLTKRQSWKGPENLSRKKSMLHDGDVKCEFKETTDIFQCIMDYFEGSDFLKNLWHKLCKTKDVFSETEVSDDEEFKRSTVTSPFKKDNKGKTPLENTDSSNTPTCSFTKSVPYVVLVKVHGIDHTPQELIGFVNILGAERTEYSFSFIKTTFEEQSKEVESERKYAFKYDSQETFITVSYHRYPGEQCPTAPQLLHCADRSNSRNSDDKTSKQNCSGIINGEVVAHFVQLTLNDLKKRGLKPVPTGLSKHIKSSIGARASLQIQDYDTNIDLQNTDYLKLLYSFLTWPKDLDKSPCLLARAGFQRKHSKKIRLECPSCGLCLLLKEFGNKDPKDVHIQRSLDCPFVHKIEHSISEKLDLICENEPSRSLPAKSNRTDCPDSVKIPDSADDVTRIEENLCLPRHLLNSSKDPEQELPAIRAKETSTDTSASATDNCSADATDTSDSATDNCSADATDTSDSATDNCSADATDTSDSVTDNSSADATDTSDSATDNCSADATDTSDSVTDNCSADATDTSDSVTDNCSAEATDTTDSITDNCSADNVSSTGDNSIGYSIINGKGPDENPLGSFTNRYSPSSSHEVTSVDGPLSVDSVDEGATAAPRTPVSYAPRAPRYCTPHARRSSYSTWRRLNRDFENLVDAGFYYTGEEDIVRCFQCDIGLADWNPSDDPWVEHARHSPDCPFLQKQKDNHFIDRIQRQWSQMYTPKHPHMGNMRSRLETFTSSWPRDYVAQTPEKLAEAGFFYTGETDTVRCHYCDGGLREWEPGDDPWTEHARWFPFCKFVLKIKGIRFIQASSPPEELDEAEDEAPTSVAAVPVKTPSFVEECQKKELKNPMCSAAAESVMSIGYSSHIVRRAIIIYIEMTGKRTFSSAELMEIIFDLETEGVSEPQDTEETDTNDNDFQLTPKAMEMENRYMKSKITCIKCNKEERQILIISCGHRVMCETCAKDLTTCPACKTTITSTVKTFLC